MPKPTAAQKRRRLRDLVLRHHPDPVTQSLATVRLLKRYALEGIGARIGMSQHDDEHTRWTAERRRLLLKTRDLNTFIRKTRNRLQPPC